MLIRIARAVSRYKNFAGIASINALLWFAIAGISFTNASFLSQFFSTEWISILFSLQAIIAIGGIIGMGFLVKIFGLRNPLIVAIVLLQIAILFFGVSNTGVSAAFWFCVFGLSAYAAAYILDLFVEGMSREDLTGSIRGWFITSGNVAVFFAPVAIGVLVVDETFAPFLIFLAVTLTVALLISFSLGRKNPVNQPVYDSLLTTIKLLPRCRRDTLIVMGAHLLLQIFFAWVTIYAPLYLVENGVSWQEIALIFVFALIPFIILEIPLGALADRSIGETEIMAVGFVILAASTALLAFIPLSLLVLWGIAFFLTRVGAAMVEITTESYFFKQVREKDAQLISLFRMLRPGGMLVGPLLALPLLLVMPLGALFGAFGLILLLGTLAAVSIRDTK